MNEIERCPFCGSEAKLLKLFENGKGDAVYGVFCIKDLEADCSHGHYIDNYATAEEAINVWNGGLIASVCSEENCHWGRCPFSPEESAEPVKNELATDFVDTAEKAAKVEIMSEKDAQVTLDAWRMHNMEESN